MAQYHPNLLEQRIVTFHLQNFSNFVDYKEMNNLRVNLNRKTQGEAIKERVLQKTLYLTSLLLFLVRLVQVNQTKALVLEYKDPGNDKLYHHKMSLKKLKKDTPTKDALDFLKKKHSQYFSPKVIDESQIESTFDFMKELIQKLKKDMADDSKIKMQDVEEEDDFDYDLDGDFDDL